MFPCSVVLLPGRSDADRSPMLPALSDLGCHEISLGDTIGAGPEKNKAAIRAVARRIADQETGRPLMRHARHGLSPTFTPRCTGAHLRLAVGGPRCGPYAPGASGTAATEDVARAAAGGLHRQRRDSDH